MPYRSYATIHQWVREFLAIGYDDRGSVRVTVQDGADGDNAGLVIVELASVEASIYIQPREVGSAQWVTTLQDVATQDFPASGLAALSAELVMVAALTAFLEAKSREVTAENRGAGQPDDDED